MNRIAKTLMVAIAVAASAVAAGCSDGEPWASTNAQFDMTPAPMIITFAADPVKVKAGEGTTISWEVANADEVSIAAVATGDPVPFSVQTQELSGSAPVAALTSTTQFILTATKKMPVEGEAPAAMRAKAQEAGDGEIPLPEVGQTTTTQTITVEVEAPMEIQATITADKTEVLPGEEVVLTWSVTPAEGVTVAVAADSDEGLMGSEACTGDLQATSGCAIAMPTKTTVYTVTATSVEDPANVTTASVEVAVAEAKVEADIKVNGESELKLGSIENEVEVTWTVSPANAKVTVTANPSVASCTPELPNGQATEVTSAKCKLSAIPTTFSVQATVGDLPAAEDKAEVLQGAVDAGIDVRADEWAFVGETVSVELALKEGIDASLIREIQISDAANTEQGVRTITELPLTEPVKVVVPALGVKVKMIDAGGFEHNYGTVVRPVLPTPDKVKDVQFITKLALDPNNPSTRFTGVQMEGYRNGRVRIYINGSNERDIDIGSLVAPAIVGAGGTGLWQALALDKYLATFPVNAITIRPGDSKKVYIGTTGGVFASGDGGMSFSLLSAAAYISRDGHDYKGEHASCRDKMQKGIPAVRKDQLVALNQVCDVAVGRSGQMIFATDMGVYGIANADVHRTDPSSKLAGYESALAMHVTDDIECLDDECAEALAASELGVFKTTDGAASWTEFGSLGERAFSVVALGDKVFAGTASGVYVSDKAQGSWTKVGLDGTAVLSLAIDPNVGPSGMMIIAGTKDGVRVTRDSGKNWSTISLADESGEESLIKEALSVAIVSAEGKEPNTKMISVMIGAGDRALVGNVVVEKAK